MDKIRKFLAIIPNRTCLSTTYLGSKTAVVTGGTSGIGFETAKILASRGAKVIIADKVDAFDARDAIVNATSNENVHVRYLDLSSLISIRKFADDFYRSEDRLDILINNAGVGGLRHIYTKDFLQKEMQINHFGPWLLTNLLKDLLKKSRPSRIIFVSSALAYFNNLRLNNLNTISDFPVMDFMIYTNSKLCNIICARYLAEQLRHDGVTCNAIHPGFAPTNIYSGMRGEDRLLRLKRIIYYFLARMAKSPFEAAQPVAHAAMSRTLDGVTGKFFIEMEEVEPPSKARDPEFCNDICKASEEYVEFANYESFSIKNEHPEEILLSALN